MYIRLYMCPQFACLQVVSLPYLSLVSVVLKSGVITWITHPHTWNICIFRKVKINWGHLAMMMSWNIFGEIFGQISSSRFPKKVVMSLENFILYPIKLHILGFDTFPLHFVIETVVRGGVIHLRGFVWLWVAHVLQGGSDWFTSLGIVWQCHHVCLRWWWQSLNYFAFGMESFIVLLGVVELFWS